MHKSHFAAEWVLARMSSNERAAEIVGDLLEQKKNPAVFWFSIVRIAFAMTWRWLLAIPVAMLSFLLETRPYAHFVVFPYLLQTQRELQHGNTPHTFGSQPMPAPMVVGQYIALPGVGFWTVAALALCLFGWRSTVTRLGCLLAVFFTVASCTLWLPYASIAAPAALALVFALLLQHRPFRRPLLCIVAGMLSLAATFASVGFALSRLIATPPSAWIAAAAVGGYVLCIGTEAWVLTRTQMWLHPQQPATGV